MTFRALFSGCTPGNPLVRRFWRDYNVTAKADHATIFRTMRQALVEGECPNKTFGEAQIPREVISLVAIELPSGN